MPTGGWRLAWSNARAAWRSSDVHRIASHNHAVEHCRLGWELVQQLRNGRKALGEVVPIATVDDHPRAYLVRLHAAAVELHLMQSAVTGGHAIGRHGAKQLEKSGDRRSKVPMHQSPNRTVCCA